MLIFWFKFSTFWFQAIKVLNDEMQCDIIKISNLVRNKVCIASTSLPLFAAGDCQFS